MDPELRRTYNLGFSPEKYQDLLDRLQKDHPDTLDFRVAETPVFIPAGLGRQLREAGDRIVDFLSSSGFRELTEAAIPSSLRVSGPEPPCTFITLDYALSTDPEGQPVARLIELQGFPTLFFFQSLLGDAYRELAGLPESWSPYFGGLNRSRYEDLLRSILLGSEDPREVILLDWQPHTQKTRIDFYLTQDATGIQPVCLSELSRKKDRLFYRRDGKLIPVRRIYNRLIFDDLNRGEAQTGGMDLLREVNVEWVCHPNWFYRISKFTLPFLEGPWILETRFLDRVIPWPADLQHYVLKPLFSYAGQGVILDPEPAMLDTLADPGNWILQRKVDYASLIQTPDIAAKAELRMIYFRIPGTDKPVLVHNLARLSKARMVGVRYQGDHSWVGGSIGFFESGS